MKQWRIAPCPPLLLCFAGALYPLGRRKPPGSFRHLEAVGERSRSRKRGAVSTKQCHLGRPRRIQRLKQRREVLELSQALRPDGGRIGLHAVDVSHQTIK